MKIKFENKAYKGQRTVTERAIIQNNVWENMHCDLGHIKLDVEMKSKGSSQRWRIKELEKRGG